MLVRWLVRAVLAVAAFFLLSFVTFIAFFGAAWTDGTEDQGFLTMQDVSNIITTAAGLCAAIVGSRVTRRLTAGPTQEEKEPERF